MFCTKTIYKFSSLFKHKEMNTAEVECFSTHGLETAFTLGKKMGKLGWGWKPFDRGLQMVVFEKSSATDDTPYERDDVLDKNGRQMCQDERRDGRTIIVRFTRIADFQYGEDPTLVQCTMHLALQPFPVFHRYIPYTQRHRYKV